MRVSLRLTHVMANSLFHLYRPTTRAQEPPRRDVSGQPARTSPAWLSDGVIYEIFPRAFSPTGDLKGVTARLDDLYELGVTILWLMPVQPVGRERAKGTYGSPYAVRDFYAINPDYGTPDDLKRLVSEAHRRGMKLLLDMVVNHTSWDSVLMNTPAFYSHRNSRIVSPVDDWTDVADLDYTNLQLRRYMIDMMKHWLREFDVDGFRCDVAFFTPTDFWEEARPELERVKPDIAMLAESEVPELVARAFDIDYSWSLHSTLTDVLMGTRPASAVRALWNYDRTRYPQGALRLRFSDNHDERRAIARFGEKGALAASALMFTLDGVPLLYNGMEVGDTTESGAPALFERMPIFWPTAERRPHFPRIYRDLIALRRKHPAFREGELVWLDNSDAERVISFARRGESETFVVAINVTNRPWTGTLEIAGGGTYTDVTPDLRPVADPTEAPADAPSREESLPALSLSAWEFRILRDAGGAGHLRGGAGL